MSEGLDIFHPLVAQWFRASVGVPTHVQELAWPRIAGGEHVLITAPTGSGKTLASFLCAIDRLLTGEVPTGFTSVVYVSPLKALNNDIQRNLLTPLTQLRSVFEAADETFPDIRVLTRSGDTPPGDRRRMVQRPPEILITTPESLNLLLSSKSGRSILTGLSSVILDEVHGVFGTKRGVHLMSAVERLVRLSGEFQRVSLSATIRPLERVAEFVGGFALGGSPGEPVHTPRPVVIIDTPGEKRYALDVQDVEPEGEMGDPNAIWDPMVQKCKEIINRNRSTLLFTNSRRICESITAKINDGEREPIAYSHHGSLSREIRTEVETRLKEGRLKAIVATSSLEMGIDIGALDEVVMIQAPMSISSAIQRVGRAGHAVGQVSRGTLFPTHAMDVLESAVLAESIAARDIEPVQPVMAPLDVLAQILVSMTAMETWDLDQLFAQIRTCTAYHGLSRTQFDLVVNMLAGRYSDTRIRDLSPRVSVDRVDNSVAARPGAIQALYFSGGTIPDRGYFHLRHHGDNARLGELDEEFVWETAVGKTFTLGTQVWRVEKITHSEVFVSPTQARGTIPPFWKAEGYQRDFHYSERIAAFMETADASLDLADYPAELAARYWMSVDAAGRLVTFLKEQKERTRADLPHRHHLLVEQVASGPEGMPGDQLVLHTLWGGRVNVPFAMALDAAWEEAHHQRLEIYPDNNAVVLQLPEGADPEEVLTLVTPANVERLLRSRLESSGFFGARFRECAGRALVVTRNRAGQRMPLWVSRLRSQKLMQAVSRYDDFPILLEAWRTCLRDAFDMDNLLRVTGELESGVIRASYTKTGTPSPIAQAGGWQQINKYMYMGDEPPGIVKSGLREDLLRDAVFTPGLRPTVARRIVDDFEKKRQRTWPGYAPQAGRDLLDWVVERLVIPEPEWSALQKATARDGGDFEAQCHELGSKLVRIPAGSGTLTFARERAGLVATALIASEVHTLDGERIEGPFLPDEPMEADEALETLVAEVLAFYGPIAMDALGARLGLSGDRLALTVEDLVESERAIVGSLVTDDPTEQVCDAENFERLLRIQRADATPVFEALPIEKLPLFLAVTQGLTHPGDGPDGVYRALEPLTGYRAPAALWESEYLPARMVRYSGSHLDTVMQEGGLQWVGADNRQVTFCLTSDYDLLEEEGDEPVEHPPDPDDVSRLLPDPNGRYDFLTLVRQTGRSARSLSDALWEAAWRGRVANDSFAAVRKGLESDFKVPESAARAGQRAPHRGRRGAYGAWRGSIPVPGSWYRLPEPERATDALDAEERNKDRVRIVLDRYGVVFRELLQRELPAFRWGALFRALRLMELSGEVLAGYFFEGIPGPQFATHRAFRRLQQAMPESSVYWLNATDPASACGIGLDAFRGDMPRRVPSSHLAYRGSTLALASDRNGRALSIYLEPDDKDLPACLGLLRHLTSREVQPVRNLTIETINGSPAAESVYVSVFETVFEARRDYKDLVIYRKV